MSIDSYSASITKRRGNPNCFTASSSWDLAILSSPSSRRARSSRSLIASSGGSPTINESPAMNCGYSLAGSRSRSRSQVRNSLRPEAVIPYTVRSGRRPSRTVSLDSTNPSRRSAPTTEYNELYLSLTYSCLARSFIKETIS